MKKVLTLVASLLSFPTFAITPSPIYAVADDYIAQDIAHEHEEALREFKIRADNHGYRGSWRFYRFDDGRHVAFSKQASQDYQASDNEKWEEVADKFAPEFLEKNGAVYGRTITKQDFFLMRYAEDMSYEPKEHTVEAIPVLFWVEIDLNGSPVRAALKNWVAQQKEANSALYVSSYSKMYGPNLPTLFMAFHAESIVGFYQQLEKHGTHDPVQLLPTELKAAINEYSISVGKYIPEISY